MRRLTALLLAAVLAAPALAAPAPAPRFTLFVDTPPVVGVVQDSAGQPLGNAQVVVVGLNRVTTTDATGRFTFQALPAGTHHLSASLIGYAPGHADVRVPAAGTEPVRVTLTLRETPLTLTTYQVTASPLGTDPRQLSQSTETLSGRALARSLSSSVAQTLQSEPGVSVRFDGPAAASPVIRGLTGERVLVLQDGERSGDLASASTDHAISADPLAAQRIEIVRGPASLLYGNNALGGVVNIISNDIPTQIPSSLTGYAGAQAESVTPGGAGAVGFTIPVNAHVAVVAKGGARRMGDLRQGGGDRLGNTGSRNVYGVAGVGLTGRRTTGGVAYRGFDFGYGLPSADAEDARIEGRRHELRAQGERALSKGLLTSLRLGGTAQWYHHDEIEATGEVGTAFSLRTQTLDLLGRTRVGRVNGAAGASLLRRQYAASGEEALTPAADSRGMGAFVYEEIPLRSTRGDGHALVPRVQVGVRYDLYRIASHTGDPKFGPGRTLDFNNVSGSVGLSVPLSDAVSIAASVARAFRAPSVEELFSNAVHEASGTYDVGSPGLQAETNRGFDALLQLRAERVTGQIAGYYNRINDYIFPDIVGDTTLANDDGTTRSLPINRYSQADALLRGIEGRIEVQAARHVSVGVMGDLVRGALQAGARSGEALPFLPPARLGAFSRFDNGRFSASADVRHAFAQHEVPVPAVADDPSGIATDAYTLVNLSAGYSLLAGGRIHALTLRLDNAADARYRDAASRIKSFAFNPGRNLALVYQLFF